VDRPQFDALSTLVDAPDTELLWFTDAARRRAFGDLTIRATEAINADPQQAADDFARSPPRPRSGLVVRDPRDAVQRLEVGWIWQRVHLAATVAGLGMQPLCQVPERTDREASAGLPPDLGTAMAALLPASRYAIMTFRIGHPTTDALRSPRRPAGDVVRR
jgi:hypothetical protein